MYRSGCSIRETAASLELPAGTVQYMLRGIKLRPRAEALTGRKLSPAHIEKIRVLKTGLVQSAATRRKRSLALRGRVKPVAFVRHMSETRRGKSNPNYRHDLSARDRAHLRVRGYTPGYNNWSRAVRARDHDICVVCDGPGELAHHLNGYRSFPEQRADLDNGVTLCSNCHTAFHRRYGRLLVTKQQFTEFLRRKMG
jgi:5-methylcytosine-specific restriction endonuclease McrA